MGGASAWFGGASLLPGAGEGFLIDADRNMSCHGRVVKLVFVSGSLEYGTNSISGTVLYTEKIGSFQKRERDRQIKAGSFRKRKTRTMTNQELTLKQRLDRTRFILLKDGKRRERNTMTERERAAGSFILRCQ